MRIRKGIVGLVAAVCVGSVAHVAAAKTESRLIPTDRAPSAFGTVDSELEGPNTRIDVKVNGLVPPFAARDATTRAYVVWAQPLNNEGPPQNLGALNIGENRESQLKTLTPLRNFQLFVTPESDARTPVPSGPHLLTGLISPHSHP